MLHFSPQAFLHIFLVMKTYISSLVWNISMSILLTSNVFLRTYTCGRSAKSTNSYILYHAMDVSLYHLAFSLKIRSLLLNTIIWGSNLLPLFRPTSEFPHPLSRVKQPAGYRVSLHCFTCILYEKERIITWRSLSSQMIWPFLYYWRVRGENKHNNHFNGLSSNSIKTDHFRKWWGMNGMDNWNILASWHVISEISRLIYGL